MIEVDKKEVLAVDDSHGYENLVADMESIGIRLSKSYRNGVYLVTATVNDEVLEVGVGKTLKEASLELMKAFADKAMKKWS